MPQLQITQNTVRYEHEILQLRNVTRVGTYEYNIARPYKAGPIVGGFVVTVIAVMAAQSDGPATVSIVVALVAGLLTLFAVRANLNAKTKAWAVHIQTSSGSVNLLASYDRNLIENVVQQICDAMEADHAFSQTINIDNRQLVDNSLVATNSTFVNNSTVQGSFNRS